MTFIRNLKLHNFRCYERAEFSALHAGLIVLHGANGAGKTNVLEAVSLLSPGRGLRGAKMAEIQSQDTPKGAGTPWAVAAQVQTEYGLVQVGTGLEPSGDKRLIRVNGENVRGQAALAEYVACVWLTPQMDRLFIDSASHRRRFLDRLVFGFDPGHSGRVSRYENAMRQRSKLLQEGGADASWLDSLEAQMAETGTAIAAARLDFAQRLQSACLAAENAHFPTAHLAVHGTLEGVLASATALEVEEMFTYALKDSRVRDALTGGAATGPHKSDLLVHYIAKDMAADQCSTGEQKALLIGITLAHARLIAGERGFAPVLLLDEVAAHLDEERRAGLYALLEELSGQVWLTGTDGALFSAIEGSAQFFEVQDGAVKNLTQNRSAA
ncbi:MAG TPA: DNA replication/repair protein RecF [Alphaproteobacteria bacterium]|nr:DNA replication/repair protein RecF [Alphaproteobacteria bacterium]USO05485.1 MAG: DNA replication/repair protein RecF [Rhodospirillales bacterium]HOO81494.1 DNA replication/repair protein RecF [Alphaproteobacteria bacterium]